MILLVGFLRSLFIHRETLILENLALRQQLATYKRCAFSIFVFTDFIGLFRPALFLHPRMIHPLDP